MSILETIVAYKKREVESCREVVTTDNFRKYTHFKRECYSLKNAVLSLENTGIIAEFKRKSPSKGIINDKVTVEKVVQGYASNGASAVSVLTDFNFFGGSADDLLKAREVVQIPILRKDFIISDYQIYEAKAIGADAILLIASILSKDEISYFAKLAHDLGMEVLMEIHAEVELSLLNEHLDIIGVNNRDLRTFEVDLEHSAGLALKIPSQFVKISESGIASVEDIEYLRQHDFRGFLIGENFMRTPDPVVSFASFVSSLRSGKDFE
jgi:indole-3-glycerol phosphate synthase